MIAGAVIARRGSRAGDRSTFAGALVGLVALFPFSPQLQYLRFTILPPGTFYAMLMAAFVAVGFARRGVVAAVLSKERVTFLLVAAFVTQAFARLFDVDVAEWGYASGDATFHQYVTNVLLLLPPLILLLAVRELGPRPLRAAKAILILGWSASLFAGLPVLVEQPFIARSMMAEGAVSLERFKQWSAYGIGDYSYYTPYAIVWAAMLSEVLTYSAWWRVAGVALLAGGAAATLMSTFTMAAVWLAANAVLAVLMWVGGAPNRQTTVRRGAVAVGITATAGALYVTLGAAWEQLDFVSAKAERLFSGITSTGLAGGDETGRGAWVVDAFRYLWEENPFLGFIPGVTRLATNEHSSLADTFTLFGVVGLVWLAVLWRLYRAASDGVSSAQVARINLVAFALFMVSGVMNPTWYFYGFVLSLFAMTLVPKVHPYLSPTPQVPSASVDVVPPLRP